MKRFVLMFLLALFALPILGQAQQRRSNYQRMRGELVVNYQSPNGTHFQMIFDSTDGRITLQMPVGRYARGDSELVLLKTEVERLVASLTPVRLGRSSYSFYFSMGAFPIWGPHTLMTPQSDFRRIFFAEGAWVHDRMIHARGPRWRPIGYYPYQLNS